MVERAVIDAIDEVLRAQLGSIGYERADIAEETDHDGEAILEIVVHYRKIGSQVDPSPTFNLARHVKDAIRPLGDGRFPHFRHLFPEDQELKVA
jgi:hypothetical protein